jgi:hypothetical protein
LNKEIKQKELAQPVRVRFRSRTNKAAVSPAGRFETSLATKRPSAHRTEVSVNTLLPFPALAVMENTLWKLRGRRRPAEKRGFPVASPVVLRSSPFPADGFHSHVGFPLKKLETAIYDARGQVRLIQIGEMAMIFPHQRWRSHQRLATGCRAFEQWPPAGTGNVFHKLSAPLEGPSVTTKLSGGRMLRFR